MINASNSKALPAARYRIQQHNKLQQANRISTGIQPVRYVKVTKKILIKKRALTQSVKKDEKPKIEKSTAKKLVQPARNVWQKGHGTIERVDKKTGDIFHLVRKEAVYELEPQNENVESSNSDTKNNQYKQRLICVKVPLKVNQKKPSEMLPQETIKKQ